MIVETFMIREQNLVPENAGDQNEGVVPESKQDASSNAARRANKIATRAYHHAERRGFGPDGQVEDWLRAEQEIDGAERRGGVAAEQSHLSDSPQGGANVTSRTTVSAEEEIEPDQVERWARMLGVSGPRLREAIKRAGSKVNDVKHFLATHPWHE